MKKDLVEPPGTAPGSDPFIPRAFIAIFPTGTDYRIDAKDHECKTKNQELMQINAIFGRN